MKQFFSLLDGMMEYRQLKEAIEQGRVPVSLTGAAGAHKTHIIASLVYQLRRPALVIVPDESTAIRFAADLNTLLRVDYEDSGVTYLEGRYHSADEVVGTRSVHYVELVVHELRVERCGVDGTLVDLFDLRVVTDCVLGFYASSAVDDLAFEHHCFRQRGLTGFRASQKYDISDVSGLVGFHFIKRLIISS